MKGVGGSLPQQIAVQVVVFSFYSNIGLKLKKVRRTDRCRLKKSMTYQ
jgi:hypothetical protein